MKRNRFFRVLAAAVILSLLMIAIPMTPALAAATVVISSPTTASGPPGTVVTLNCSDFTASQTYAVYFGGTSITTGSTSSGDFAAVFTVPSRARGNYPVAVTTTADGSIPLVGGFNITPEIAASISTGHVGDTVTVSGIGFEASKTVTIFYDTASVGTDTTDTNGAFAGFTFTVPASTKGTHTISGRDTTVSSPTVNFIVSPEITVSPTSGAVGDTVTVSGTGFGGSKTITITFDAVTMTSTSTSSSGTFSATTFAVPEASRGTHTVKAQDSSANYDTATFTVSASITINPTSGPSGTNITITGDGFGASRPVTITYSGTAVTTNPPSVTTNSAGYFTATFAAPVGAAGNYAVAASDGTDTATATFVSTTDATISQTTTTTAPGYVGMSLTITGTGFTPSHAITVTYSLTATETDTLATMTSDASGNFTILFTIPASVAGAHTITVTDDIITKTFTFTMESNAPPTPELTLPLVDTKLKDKLFEWEAVEDVEPKSEPVTYDLQVSIDDTFSEDSLVVNQTGLITATYTLPDEEELESTDEEAPYYWRVRAVDAASNASGWSEASTFTVGFSFEFTGWVVWVTMVVVAIAFFFIGLWIGRRGGGGGEYW